MVKNTAAVIVITFLAEVALSLLLLPSPASARLRVPPAAPLLREEQAVFVGGVMETWVLQWRTPPEPECDVDGAWPTAPCAGFAYGEAGTLDLVRYRQAREFERLNLTPFSTGFPDKGAVLQRWPFVQDDVFANFQPINSPAMTALRSRVRARPPVKIMSLADYDHDGNATEFFFQTEAAAGHRYGVVVGISTTNPHLHAFGTALHANTALVMQPDEWEALLHANGPVRVMDWKCPDHGATTDVEYELEATAEGIRVISREFDMCGQEPRRLLHEEHK